MAPNPPPTSRRRALASLALNSYLADRRHLARELGQLSGYEGSRNYNKVLGYPSEIPLTDYITRYDRQDIAARIVDLPAQDTWRKPPPITEDGNADTEFAKAWENLETRLRIYSLLARGDKISGIGRYGVMFIGFADGSDRPDQEVQAGSITSPEDVIFLRPFSEDKAGIKTWDTDPQSERFGLPVLYSLRVDSGGQMDVHYTRCLHLADNKLDSEVYGVPRLKRVFNRLDDMLKVVGGSAEATWLNMRPGTLLTTQPGFEFGDDDTAKKEIEGEIEEYLHGMARVMTIEGVDLKQIAGQIMSPEEPFNVYLSLIAAASGIPQRILLGSAAGELASAIQDEKQWYGHVAWRQANYAEPEILRPFIDMLISYGALPAPGEGGYDIGELDTDSVTYIWPPLFQLSDTEQAEVRSSTATAIAALKSPSGRLPLAEGEIRLMLGYEETRPPDPEGTEALPPPTTIIAPTAAPVDEGDLEEVGVEPPPEAPEAQAARTVRDNRRAGSITISEYINWLALEAEAAEDELARMQEQVGE